MSDTETSPYLAREDQIILCTIGAIEALIDREFISGPKILTQKGRDEYEALQASGFKMTDEEMKWATAALNFHQGQRKP